MGPDLGRRNQPPARGTAPGTTPSTEGSRGLLLQPRREVPARRHHRGAAARARRPDPRPHPCADPGVREGGGRARPAGPRELLPSGDLRTVWVDDAIVDYVAGTVRPHAGPRFPRGERGAVSRRETRPRRHRPLGGGAPRRRLDAVDLAAQRRPGRPRGWLHHDLERGRVARRQRQRGSAQPLGRADGLPPRHCRRGRWGTRPFRGTPSASSLAGTTAPSSPGTSTPPRGSLRRAD